MSLYDDKYINEGTRLVVWKIEEDPGWFLSQLNLDEEELQRYEGFRTEQRRLHWLAYRHILKNIMMKGQEIRVRYDQSNKPFIDLCEDHISVSHSGKFAVAIISNNHVVGVDVEEVAERLKKVSDKFLGEHESGCAPESLPTEKLCLYWCAKEAIYKAHGERMLDFKNHIRIGRVPEKLEGQFRGGVYKPEAEKQYSLVAERLENYFLVYVTGTLHTK
jgi:4'-phosphopantetheinyl transferase